MVPIFSTNCFQRVSPRLLSTATIVKRSRSTQESKMPILFQDPMNQSGCAPIKFRSVWSKEISRFIFKQVLFARCRLPDSELLRTVTTILGHLGHEPVSFYSPSGYSRWKSVVDSSSRPPPKVKCPALLKVGPWPRFQNRQLVKTNESVNSWCQTLEFKTLIILYWFNFLIQKEAEDFIELLKWRNTLEKYLG